jgi:DNA-binding IclR family transcriptional regulator
MFIAASDEGVAAKEAALGCGVALPTAYHLLNTLVSEGLLEKDASRRYRLGVRAGMIGEAFSRSDIPSQLLLDAVHRVADATDETVYVSAWRGPEIRVLACREGSRAVRVAGVEIGPCGHGHARAAGKVLLAHATAEARNAYLATHALAALTRATITDRDRLLEELRRVEQQGFATDLEEFAEGVCCVSVPVFRDGHLVAALTVSCPAQAFGGACPQILDVLREQAQATCAAAPVAV